MALFGKKKTENTSDAEKVSKQEVSKVDKPTTEVKKPTSVGADDLSWVLQSPRLTEKAAIATSGNVYTFNVHKDANKIQVKKAVSLLYKVTPVKVNIVINKPEEIFSRGNKGKRKGFKKAMVFLKKGDKIEFA